MPYSLASLTSVMSASTHHHNARLHGRNHFAHLVYWLAGQIKRQDRSKVPLMPSAGDRLRAGLDQVIIDHVEVGTKEIEQTVHQWTASIVVGACHVEELSNSLSMSVSQMLIGSSTRRKIWATCFTLAKVRPVPPWGCLAGQRHRLACPRMLCPVQPSAHRSHSRAAPLAQAWAKRRIGQTASIKPSKRSLFSNLPGLATDGSASSPLPAL